MRSLAIGFVSIGVGLFALGMDAPAHANIQSPGQEACAKKKAGDACELPSGESGSCKPSKCNELDYSQGSPPKSIEVDCVVCEAGGTQPPGPGPGGEPPGPGPVGVGDGGGEPPGPGAGGPTEEAKSPTAGEPATGVGSPSPEPPATDSKCSVSAQGSAAGGVWLGVVLLAAARRRRR